MKSARAWLWTEPDGDNPPARNGFDWVLATVVAAVTTVEAVSRDGIVWRPLAIAFGVTLALTMLWRRAYPLAMVVVGFGGFLVIDLAFLLATGEPFTLNAGAFVVVLLYSLFRWGTSTQAVVGSLIVLAEGIVAITTDFTDMTEAIGGLAVLLFVAAFGVAIRYWRIARARQLDQVRFHEREALARELHDTVAHHVTAIAVQAQAGRFLAGSRDVDGAVHALDIIDQEAARTLAEMRSVVGSLRRDDRTPQPLPPRGIADLARLANADRAAGPRVEVERLGDLDDVRPSVQAALYRAAQESITNVKRHARNATRIHVLVIGETDAVRLTVDDDGQRVTHPRPAGYGIVGMTERVTLLGGKLEAGPGPDHGWTVRATIPRQRNPV